jgi:hypothetical protein
MVKSDNQIADTDKRMTDDDAIIAAQRQVYRSNFIEHGDSPLGTYQSNQVTQYLRFDSLLRHIAPHFEAGNTVHDVGAGLCDLYQYLQTDKVSRGLIYSGTEIVQDMIDLATEKYPAVTLLNRNFLAPSDERYSFVVLSGTFNIPAGVESGAWKQMCMALVNTMFDRADKAISFNFLTSYRTFTDPNLFYFDPLGMFHHITTKLSRFVHLDACYPLYECTVTVFRKEYLASLYAHDDLKKYFM